jgi:quercetin dioxygenase-like cupin family protein
LFHPEGYSLWKLTGALHAGAELEWGSDHGDEGIFVLSGELEFDGKHFGVDGAIIIEAGVIGMVRATADTRLLHFGPIETQPPSNGPLGPPAVEGRHVHVFNGDDAEAIRTGKVTFYSDGACPTCRIALFTVDRSSSSEPRVSSKSHKHSTDEIIHILAGTMNVGPITIPAGQGIAVPGDLRYGYTATPDLRFINYRRDAATSVQNPGDEPWLESRSRMIARLASGASKP